MKARLLILLSAAISLVGASAGSAQPIEPPPFAQDLISKLRTSGRWGSLDEAARSCGVVFKKYPTTYYCSYRSGNIEVGVFWVKKSGQFSSLAIHTRESQASLTSAWDKLETSFQLLCAEITPEEAAGEASEKLLHATWRKWDGSQGRMIESEAEIGAYRWVSIQLRATCNFYLSQQIESGAVRAKLEFRLKSNR